MRTPEETDPAPISYLTNILTWNKAPICQEVSSMLFWISSVSSKSPVQWSYIILPPKISTRLLGLRQLVGLAEENVIVDSFADNLAQKNKSLLHYLQHMTW